MTDQPNGPITMSKDQLILWCLHDLFLATSTNPPKILCQVCDCEDGWMEENHNHHRFVNEGPKDS